MNLGISPRINAPQQKIQQNRQSIKQNQDVSFGMEITTPTNIISALGSFAKTNSTQAKGMKQIIVEIAQRVEPVIKEINRNIDANFGTQTQKQLSELRQSEYFNPAWEKIFKTVPPTEATPAEETVRVLIPNYPNEKIDLRYIGSESKDGFYIYGTPIGGNGFELSVTDHIFGDTEALAETPFEAEKLIRENERKLVSESISNKLQPLKDEIEKMKKEKADELIDAQYEAFRTKGELG